MGFKVNTSFLKYLTMGALASQKVMAEMTKLGLSPIELERYSCSNKIWATKVKRLRLPDLLCVRTGLRVEVKGKSALSIKLSDSPTNPSRRWSSGLGPSDLIAFVQCTASGTSIHPSDFVELFHVEDLSNCALEQTKLGRPKSASEGAERDREWPSVVPKRGGYVTALEPKKIKVKFDTGSSYTYKLGNGYSYLDVGDRFEGGAQFIGGLPKRKVQLSDLTKLGQWDPRKLVNGNETDRYVLAKSLSAVGSKSDFPLLTTLMHDDDARVSLEAAGTLAKLGSVAGLNELLYAVHTPREEYLSMEAVLILSELSKSPLAKKAKAALLDIANDPAYEGDEIRQAAIWGLGKAGFSSFADLMPFLDSSSEEERIHAILGFGSVVPEKDLDRLVDILADDAKHLVLKQSAHSVICGLSQFDLIIPKLVELFSSGSPSGRLWAIATLGSMTPSEVDLRDVDRAIKQQIRPLQQLAPETNWTKREENLLSFAFLRGQNVS